LGEVINTMGVMQVVAYFAREWGYGFFPEETRFFCENEDIDRVVEVTGGLGQMPIQELFPGSGNKRRESGGNEGVKFPLF
jgi:hypothetical protein